MCVYVCMGIALESMYGNWQTFDSLGYLICEVHYDCPV